MLRAALCCYLLAAAAPAWPCYTVTSATNQVVYHAVDPPVDMSRPIHETLPQVFPGGHMVFDLSTDCPRAVPVPPSRHAAVGPRDGNVVVRVLAAPDYIVPGDLEHRDIPTAALVADLGPRLGERSAH